MAAAAADATQDLVIRACQTVKEHAFSCTAKRVQHLASRRARLGSNPVFGTLCFISRLCLCLIIDWTRLAGTTSVPVPLARDNKATGTGMHFRTAAQESTLSGLVFCQEKSAPAQSEPFISPSKPEKPLGKRSDHSPSNNPCSSLYVLPPFSASVGFGKETTCFSSHNCATSMPFKMAN